jgi:DNA replication and repair protein RecF
MINSVALRNYRSYVEAAFELGPAVSIIVGSNASGKTNLLESIYMLTRGSSFRVSDKDLINHNSPWARIDGIFENSERTVKLESGGIKTKKTISIDSTVRSRLSYAQIIPTVLFEPEDMRIVYGSPERRRKYLDSLLTQTEPLYKHTLLRYQKLLKQRNTLLKQGGGRGQIFAWNIILASAAAEITRYRSGLIHKLQAEISTLYGSIADSKDIITLSYISDTPPEEYSTKLVKKLELSFARDVARGHTSYGPHKDDMNIEINSRPSISNASRGEARTIMLSLKILETEHIKSVHGVSPLLLLDDVFSELDGTRRRLLTSYLKDKQSIITTTDADIIGKSFTKIAHIISL